MPVLAHDLLAQKLHDSNARLGFWLDSITPDCPASSAPTRPVTPQQMSGLLSELMRAGQWLRNLPEEKDAELGEELSAYRKNVERIRELLPSIHSTLLRQRARLEQERTRVEAAAEWMRRSQQTL